MLKSLFNVTSPSSFVTAQSLKQFIDNLPSNLRTELLNLLRIEPEENARLVKELEDKERQYSQLERDLKHQEKLYASLLKHYEDLHAFFEKQYDKRVLKMEEEFAAYKEGYRSFTVNTRKKCRP